MTNSRLLGGLPAAFLACLFIGVGTTGAGAQTLTTIYSFCAQGGVSCTDGQTPQGTLIQGTDGNFYGTTTKGGDNQQGTVFKVTPNGTLTTLYSFCSQGGVNCSDGAQPWGGVVEGPDGNFYGTTVGGGTAQSAGLCGLGAQVTGSVNFTCGTIFKVTSSGVLTTLYSFCPQASTINGTSVCLDGSNPYGQLVLASDGNFYGTTAGQSTVFKITPGGALTTLSNFCSQPACGYEPMAGLVQGTDGNFYGTTEYGFGAPASHGTIFKITPTGVLSTLYAFCSQSGCSDGGYPTAKLVQGSDGNFYGTTNDFGGTGALGGTVFRVTPSGVFTTLHTFCSQTNCMDGEAPYGGLIQGSDGNFYGTTYLGGLNQLGICFAGAYGCGTAYMITPAGALTTLHNFCSVGTWPSCADGSLPVAGLVQGSDFNFYGIAAGAGVNDVHNTGGGTVFVLAALPIASVSPASLTFASQLVNTSSASQTLTLSNTGNGSLSVASIKITGAPPDFTETDTCAAPITSAQSCQINVTFTPQSTDARSATLTITDNDGGAAGSTQTVALSGTATAPVASLSTASLTFTSQTVGTTSVSQQITLSNSGTAALTISSIAASGDFAETNTCGGSVTANSSCAINVTFTPILPGTRTGTLTITDNNSGVSASTQTISLTGTGTVPVNGGGPKLLVSNLASSGVLAFSAATGALIGPYINTTGSGLSDARGMAFGPDGNLYVSSVGTNSILRFNGITGAFIDTFVPAASGGLSVPDGLTLGPDKNLYVASSGQSAVLQFNGTTGAFMSVFAITPLLSGINDLTFGPDGNLYVISRNTNSVVLFNGSTGAFVKNFISPGLGLSVPIGLRFGPDGNLYVANQVTQEVLKFNGSTGASMGIFASGNGLSVPIGIAFGPDNNLYVANAGGNSVLQFNGSTGAFMSTFVALGAGGLSVPKFLLFTAAGAGQPNPVPFVGLPSVPAAVTPGTPGVSLTVTGAGFDSRSVVNWNGSPIVTTFVSRDQLTATVPAADVASNGTATVTVANPAPGGGVSNVAYVETTNPTAALTFGTSSYTGFMTPSSVVVGDLNGDGKPDLVVTNGQSGNVSVLLGNGDGTFQTEVNYTAVVNYVSGGSIGPVIAGDLNGDGNLDLVVVNRPSSEIDIILGNGDGTFRSPVNYTMGDLPISLVLGDFNGDGRLDLAVTNGNGGANNVSVLLGNGDGTFQAPVAYATALVPWSVAVGDFNGDGVLDLVAADGSGQPSDNMSVLLGNGDGTFRAPVNFTVGAEPGIVTVADFNGDGKPDLAVTNSDTNNVMVLLGNGDGTFQAAVNYAVGVAPGSVAVGDFNGDSKLDLVVSNSQSNTVSVLLGDGDGTFQTAVNYPVGTSPFPVALGDFNGDGRLDLAIGDSGSNTVSIMLQSPLASLSTNSLSFSSQAIGSASTAQSLTLSNTGSAALNIASIGIAGTNPGDFNVTNTCGTSVPTGGSCSLSVTFTPAGTGTRSATITVTDNSNLVVGSTQIITLTGTGVAPLVITASSGSISYGGTVPAITPNFAGFANGDTAASLTTQPTCTTTATSSSPVGTYPTTCSGAVDPNYTISYVAGTVTITAAPLTITASSGAMAYGATIPVITPAFSGFVNGENSSVLTAQPICSTTATSTSPAGSSLPSTCSGAAAVNYIIAFFAGTVSVSKATSTTTITSHLPNPSSMQQAVTVTFTVAPQFSGTPSGMVTVTASSGQSCTTTLAAGSGGCQLTFAAAGTPTLTAAYSGDGNFLATTSAAVSQTVNPAASGNVTLSATSLVFGNQLVGTTSTTQTVRLTNKGTMALTIAKVTASNQFIVSSLCSGSLAPGRGCSIQVRFRPTATGLQMGTVTITDSDPTSPQTIALSGTGVAPLNLVSPLALTFNSPLNITGASQLITVSNTGTAPMSITNIALSGANPGQFGQRNNCGPFPATLAINAICTINVTFSPTAASPLTKTALLRVAVAPPATSVSVSLTGAIVVPTYALSSTSAAFGNQPIGTTSASQTITLTNSASAPLTINNIVLGGTNPGQFLDTNTCGTFPVTLADGAVCTLGVAFRPTSAGSKSASVTIRVAAPGVNQSISLSGTGQ